MHYSLADKNHGTFILFYSFFSYSPCYVWVSLVLGFFGLRELFFPGRLAFHQEEFSLLPSMISPTWVKSKHEIQKSKLQFFFLRCFSQKNNALVLSSHFVSVIKMTIFTFPRPLLLPFSSRNEVKIVCTWQGFFSNSKWCLKLQATCKSFQFFFFNGCLVLGYHPSKRLGQCSVQGLQSIQCCVDVKIRLNTGPETSPEHTWVTWKPVK